ncbi:Ectonucleotide pyrophosphatase/phosphodiesterase family member 1 [Armadillidium vulgare]|nr:Ectonucleotide pyrophosphatase/phosphodiesterase family member 1 [Armadillidium vulgare]
MDLERITYIGINPHNRNVIEEGVMTPFMKPSYPSITFPNHYTIVTGLLPPYHGIVANKFFDPVFNATFRKGRKESYERRFWGGEPIWVTAEKQGKRAATFFWPGSETEGMKPTYWEKFNNSVPFESRVEAVLNWLDLPKPQRPDLINFYLNEPDTQGHRHGPDSQQVNEALKRVDDTVQLLLEGLESRSLLSCVNLILLADHGMAAAGAERVIRLQEFVPEIHRGNRYFNGVFPRFQPLNQSTFQKEVEIMNQLSCKVPQMRVYHKRHLPTRWHFGTQRRIENIVLDLDAGYQADFDGSYRPDEGDHGYDNIFYVMNALFLAHGPSFKSGVEVESFQNIELYNLMCVLLGVSPAPNNGTWGALHHMLLDPPQIRESFQANCLQLPSYQDHDSI